MSGYAELLKHGLISDGLLYAEVLAQMDELGAIPVELLRDAIEIKNKVVTADPLEKGERKNIMSSYSFYKLV